MFRTRRQAGTKLTSASGEEGPEIDSSGRSARWLWPVAAVGAAGVATTAAILLARRREPVEPHPVLQGGPLLIAHRGGLGLAPENTLPAFEQAITDWAADMIELDVHATADGRCVVIHDDTVDRTTDGTGAVAEMTLAQLREFDAGYRFTKDGGRTHPFRGRGIRIPTIEETLETTAGVRLTIELKSAAAQGPLFEALRRTGAGDRVVVAGQHDAFRTRLHEFDGPVSASMEQFRRFVILYHLRVAGLRRPPFDVAQVPDRWRDKDYLERGMIAALRRHGVPVHVWTVNETERMAKFLEDGADGIITDRPDRLATLLTRRYGRPPAPAAARGASSPW